MKQLLFSSSDDIYVLMCSMNATIYDCMQMENSARVDLYTSQSSTLRSTLAELRWPGRSRNKAVDIEHCAVDIEHCAVDIEHCALDIEQLT